MKTYVCAKGRMYALMAALFAIVLLVSCHKDDDLILRDMAPVMADVFIQDATGNNLLDPDFEGNIRGKKITAEYNGEEYVLNWEEANKTRYYMPHFTGLTLQSGYTQVGDRVELDPSKSYLSFGEFDGEENQDISLTLKIEGYPMSWNIDVIHRVTWKNNKPKVTNSALLNGKEVGYNNIIITL